MVSAQTENLSLDELRESAKAHHAAKNYPQAYVEYRAILAMDPDLISAWENLGRCAIALNRGPEAADIFFQIAKAQPEKIIHRKLLCHALSVSMPGEIKADIVSAALEPDNVYHDWVYPHWIAYVRTLNLDVYSFNDALLLRGLALFRCADVHFERFAKSTRSEFLKQALSDPSALKSSRPFLAALADQCFYSDYVYSVTKAETQDLETLRARLTDLNEEQLLVYACYAPLHSLPFLRHLTPSATFASVYRDQVINPLREAQIRSSISPRFPLADAVSKEVRAQYEDHPYPRWKLANLPTLKHDLPKLPQNILIAGCGTGRQVAHAAQIFPDSQITAIDLSTASLAHAIRQGEDLGYNARVTYHQMDLLDLPRLNEKFDHIICSGVLHHMKDPLAGWASLKSVATPDAVMKIALYSEIARQDIVALRNVIAQKGYAPDEEGMRACRDDLMAAPDWDDTSLVGSSVDFYNLSTCRDLLFHVQEHRFTLPRLEKALEQLDLQFLGFEFVNPRIPAMYAEKYPADSYKRDLQNWHAFETANPRIFDGMYQFQACLSRIDKQTQ